MLEIRRHPELIAQSAWIAHSATVLGNVQIGDHASIWFGTVIRGDTDKISVGAGTNVQDLCCLHTDAGLQCSIGENVTVGHAAVVHGASIEPETLIGMRAVVMNRAHIGRHSILGAGAVVTEGTQVPPRSLVLGIPGKVVRRTTDVEVERILASAKRYILAAEQYKKQFMES